MANNISSVTSACNNSLKTLQKNMNIEIKNELIRTGEEVVELIKKYIHTEWYGTYTPKDYERTYNLVDSVKYTLKGNSVYIEFDRRRFQYKKVEDFWSPHRGFDNQKFVQGLIEFVNDGTGGGGIKVNPRRGSGGIDLVSYAEDVLNQQINKLVQGRISSILSRSLK